MSTATEIPTERPQSRTRIQFDLAEVLTPEELAQFERAAKDAGAPSLTEHFLNLTLRLSGPIKAI